MAEELVERYQKVHYVPSSTLTSYPDGYVRTGHT